MRLGLFASIWLTLASPAVAQVSAAVVAKSPDAASISTALEARGHVPIIVEFQSPVAPNAIAPDPATLAAVKPQIAAAGDAVISSHFGSAADPRPGSGFTRSLQRFEISPMFAVNVTRAELEALAADPRVVRIHQNKLDRPTLIDSVPLIGMTTAYSQGATGNGFAVAVVDTGVQSNHEFVSGKVVVEACFSNGGGGAGRVSLCPSGANSQTGAGSANAETAQCINGSANLCEHGTHVAGIAAGLNTNQQGGEPPNGVAKNAQIVAIQVFTRFNNSGDCSPSAAPCVLTWNSDQIAALDWIFANAVNLAGNVKLASVNMSLGGGQFTTACDSDSRKTSIDNLLGVNVATAIASGNNGFTNAVGAPGCISSAVTVGSSTKADAISSFSNMASMVDLMAPGSSIQSSIPIVPSSTTAYAFFNGTSMATPHVAGTFAAIRSACPSATVSQILTALQNTGVTITDNRAGGTISKPRIRVDLALQQLACARKVAHDYDGNGKSDIAWRDTSGNTAVWLMNGTTISTSAGLGNPGGTWAMVGQRDFDGAGKHDLLWKDGSGNVAIWFMNGAAVSSMAGIANVGPNWNVAGTGDFSGDNKGDVLWRDTSGNVAIWLMNGTTIVTQAGLGNPGGSWQVAGVGDFNGDSMADVLWKDSAGNVVIWFMNGTTIASSGFVGNVGPTWNISATGDLNGDGKADIVWRDTSGNVAISLMNGSTVSSTVGLGNPGGTWAIQETGDFNGDGKADVLWKDGTGTVAIWFMNGTTISSSAGIANVGPNWNVQTAGAN